MMKNLILLVLIVQLFISCQREGAPEPPAGQFNLVSPAEGEREVVLKPTLVWNRSNNATTYNLTIADNEEFISPIVEVGNLADTVYSLQDELNANTYYYWKVLASNSEGIIEANNSNIWFRTLVLPPLPSPTISKYYVSPNGKDHPERGSLEHPFHTVAYAATMVPASEGDTIFLLPGTYTETEPVVLPIGVNLIGSGEDKTILKSSGVSLAKGIDPNNSKFKLWYDGSLIQLVSPHFSVFRNRSSTVLPPEDGNQTIGNFTIDGNNKTLKAGVWVENRNNVTMHHMTFKNLDQRGAVFGPGEKNWFIEPVYYMKGIKIHDCTFINSGKDIQDEILGNLCIAQLDGAEIFNISINDNQGYGIKFIYDGFFKNVKIHDCNIILNEVDNEWGEDIAIELWNLGPGNEVYNIQCNTWLSMVNHPEVFGQPTSYENLKIYNIKMIDNDGQSNKEAIEIGLPGVEVYDSYFQDKGLGVAIWEMGRENIIIRNNTFYNTTVKNNWAGGAAIYIDNSKLWNFKNLHIYNNVFDNHRTSIIVKGHKISDVLIKNNVFLNTAIADVQAEGANIQVKHNLKFSGNTDQWMFIGDVIEMNNYLANPGFKFSGDRWANYYQAASQESMVVDKGIDVGLPYKGLAPDVGRYEY